MRTETCGTEWCDIKVVLGSIYQFVCTISSCVLKYSRRITSDWGVKLSTDIGLMQRLRIRVAVPPLPHTSLWRANNYAGGLYSIVG